MNELTLKIIICIIVILCGTSIWILSMILDYKRECLKKENEKLLEENNMLKTWIDCIQGSTDAWRDAFGNQKLTDIHIPHID